MLQQAHTGLIQSAQPKVLNALDSLECNISDIVNRISDLESKLSLVLNGSVLNKSQSADTPRALNPVPLADRIEQCNGRLFNAEASLRELISRIEV